MMQDKANEEISVNYVVTWFSPEGIGKRIRFSDRRTAVRHKKNMEQDGCLAIIKAVKAA